MQLTRNDYKNLLASYREYCFEGEMHDVSPPTAVTRHYLSGCSAAEAAAFAKNFALEVEHNKQGIKELNRRVGHLPCYVLVAKHSTQVVIRHNQGTHACVVDSPHRTGLLRYAAEEKILCYGSELEISDYGDMQVGNVIRVVF